MHDTPTLSGISMDSPWQTSTTWTGRCIPIHLHFPCIANKYSSLIIRGDVDGRLCAEQMSGVGVRQLQLSQPASAMVDVGNDEDFGGLHPVMLETEPERRPATRGRQLRNSSNWHCTATSYSRGRMTDGSNFDKLVNPCYHCWFVLQTMQWTDSMSFVNTKYKMFR